MEHDDAQPCVDGLEHDASGRSAASPEAPIVGTGLEQQVARDSRVLINAEGAGTVRYVDANEIVIEYDRTEDEDLVSFEPATSRTRSSSS